MLNKLQKDKDYIIDLRRWFHMYPELSGQEEKTSQKIEEELTKYGFECKTRFGGGYGIVADLPVDGKCPLAFRADMDALECTELNDFEFKSKNENVAHMCGHDGNMSVLLGAAKYLSEHKSELKRGVRFIFQPHEEMPPGGALGMIEAGVLDGVEEIYGTHFLSNHPTGNFAIRNGAMFAGADRFYAKIIGKGGHAAMPNMAKDPIVPAANVITSLQTIVSRETAPSDSMVVSVCVVKSGGAFNIIPDEVELGGTVRTLTNATHASAPEKMERIFSGIAQAHGVNYELEYVRGYPVTLNHDENVQKVCENVTELYGPEKLTCPCEALMGGEDFSYYLQQRKGAYIFVGCAYDDREENPPLHNSKFDLNEEAILPAVGFIVHTALK